MKLRIGKDFDVERELLEDVVSIVGRRGRGKTTTAVVLVEELVSAGARFCVADPVGVWHGLKSSKSGKSAGLPVVVMGGDRGDVPLEETAGKVIANFVANPASPSVVLDFLKFRKGQMARFMTDFLEELYHRNRSALHLVLDEADKFAPQRVMGNVARLVGAAEDVVKMGRARGILPVLITQRPASLNKNVLSQTGLLIAHALTGPHDRKAVDEWIRENAEEEEREEFHNTIAKLPKGTAWFWQPEAQLFRQVRVRDRTTFDSSATPKSGTARPTPKVVAEVDLEKLKGEISATIERAKENDPKELKKRIAKLERELKAKPAAETTVERVEVPVLSKDRAKRLSERLVAVKQELEASIRYIQAIDVELKDRVGEISAALENLAHPRRAEPAPVAPKNAQKTRVNVPSREQAEANGLKPRHREILESTARYEQMGQSPVPAKRIAHSMGLSLTGTFRNYLSELRTAGLISGPAGAIQLTGHGRAQAGDVDDLHSHEDVMNLWRSKLAPRLVQILDVAISVYPNSLSHEEVAERLGLQLTGTFRNYLSELRTLGLIDRSKGQTRASDSLFP